MLDEPVGGDVGDDVGDVEDEEGDVELVAFKTELG